MGNLFSSVNDNHILFITNAVLHYNEYIKKNENIYRGEKEGDKEEAGRKIANYLEQHKNVFNQGIKYYDYYYPRQEALRYKKQILRIKELKEEFQTA